MSRYTYGGWRPYVPVAERRRKAARKIAKMKGSGRDVAPVEIVGRKIATTFWGKAWCKNLEAYSDYSNRMPRGRTYVRNGSVVDLQVEAGRIRALVSGSDLYKVEVGIKALPAKRWTDLKKRCGGQIDSLIELLQGSISERVMEVVTLPGDGLFPSPPEITLSCSCPDWATMCKHVAATLYGIGARLDDDPARLFTLRGVDPTEMVESAVEQVPAGSGAAKGRMLDSSALSSVFGVDIDFAEGAVDEAATTDRKPKRAAQAKKTSTRRKGRARSKVADPSEGQLKRLQARAAKFVEASPVLCELVEDVELKRGRLYLRDERDLLMARITPVTPRSMVLEAPSGRSWKELDRGQLRRILKLVERDAEGHFHGLGALLDVQRGQEPIVQVVLHRDLGVPIVVLAEARRFCSTHREPEIVEVNDCSDRALVQFAADRTASHPSGTCLYACHDGEWGCYAVAHKASRTIETAEAWLDERDWDDGD